MREPDLRLLCERCGYHLKGLKRTDVCPECGTPVVESLPNAVRASPWQMAASWSTWWITGWNMLRRPIRSWDDIGVHPDRDKELRGFNILGAGIMLIVYMLASVIATHRFEPGMVMVLVTFGAIVACLFSLLTGIEGVGIGLITRRRKWRIDRDRRNAILSHASYGWLVAAPLMAVGDGLGDLSSGLSSRRWVLIWTGFFLGMLAFETLVYIGMQRMKYANAPGSERELAEDDATGATTPIPPTATDSSA